MANYYTEFSEILFEDLTPEEIEWLKRAIPLVQRYAENHDMYLPDTIEIERGCLWVADASSCNMEDLIFMARLFMEKFRPDAIVTISAASTCSKPRISSFGGFAIMFSLEREAEMGTWNFLADKLTEFKAPPAPKALVLDEDPHNENTSDYTLVGNSCFVTVGDKSVYVHQDKEAVFVDIFDHFGEVEDPISSAYAYFDK